MKKMEFSKFLLLQESILIWIMTLTFLLLAFICVFNGYIGSLPWLTSMSAFPWSAYGVSQACYYGKSKKENCAGGIRYDSIIQQKNSIFQSSTIDFPI